METRYTKSADGVSIAYQVYGADEPTVLCIPGSISNLMLADATPALARFWERLGRFARVVRFDKRGTGLSDRSAADAARIDQQVPDVEAVRAAAGAERVVLSGLSQGAAVAVRYALQYPERVAKLILFEGVCCDAHDPWAPASAAEPIIDWDGFFGDLETDFGAFSRRLAQSMNPSAPDTVVDMYADFLRATASPQSLRSLWQSIVGLDLRPVLKQLDVPTLIIHARGDRHHPVSHGRYLAEHIANARYVELDTDAHVPMFVDASLGETLTAIEDFVTGTVRHTADRRFAAILFVDIVDSTTEQRARGDRVWRDVVASFEEAARRTVQQFAGRVLKFQGDGLMAAFGNAGEALRAARATVEVARSLGIALRAGLHAGEAYETQGDLFGTCVNIAARVCDRAEGGQVWTTAVVEGLVEGSELRFEDRGEVELKGVGPRRLARLR
jgi:pimeloyl-ACP methyl ester carboxylesterase